MKSVARDEGCSLLLILPEVWEKSRQPQWTITMNMWLITYRAIPTLLLRLRRGRGGNLYRSKIGSEHGNEERAIGTETGTGIENKKMMEHAKARAELGSRMRQ
jgi:hypothetical protein